mgnify:CR=1 FL=1
MSDNENTTDKYVMDSHVNNSVRKRILKLPEVMVRTGKGRASIYAGAAEGSFPTPIKIGERASGWVENEIEQWIDVQIAASRNEKGA